MGKDITNKLKTKESKGGFTLIESLVLGTILTIGVASIWSLIYYGISSMKKYLDKPVIERANVIGDAREELFIEREGKRFYAEIDGKLIEDYLKK